MYIGNEEGNFPIFSVCGTQLIAIEFCSELKLTGKVLRHNDGAYMLTCLLQ